MENNYAFIDGQNMYKNIREQGWKIDYARLKEYLKETHGVCKAYIFLGYMKEHRDLYEFLQDLGYSIIFKKISKDANGVVKGNCDSDLIFRIGLDFWNFDKAVVLSGDGDYFCAIEVLFELRKLQAVLSPSQSACSEQYLFLLNENKLLFLNDVKKRICLK